MYIAPFLGSRWRNDIHDVTRKDNAYEPKKIHCATHTHELFLQDAGLFTVTVADSLQKTKRVVILQRVF